MDPFIQDQIREQSSRNEKVIAWLRCAFLLTIIPDLFVVNILPKLYIWIDLICIWYLIAAWFGTRFWARTCWWRYVVMTTDVVIVMYMLFADPGGPGKDPVTGRMFTPMMAYNFMALMGCFFVVASSLRLSKSAIIYVTALVGVSLVIVKIKTGIPLYWGIAPFVVLLITGILSLWVMGTLSKLLVNVSRKERLARFLSPEIVEQAAKDPALLQLGGKRQSVTMMFVDIRKFSVLAELHTPEEVVNILNDYFRVATDVIFKHKGTLDKYIGDALMALFGAPLTNPDDADRALRAAVEMMSRFEEFNKGLDEPLQIGIGLNTASVIAGNVGTDQRMDYTVIGDGVNIAARLEKLSKKYETKIILSENTYNQLSEKFEAVSHGDVSIEGRKAPVKVYGIPQSSVFAFVNS